MLWLIRSDRASRRLATTVLSEANRKLEVTVEARTRELATANDTLTQDILEQRWANQALDHQLRYNQLIINSIDDLVFVISRACNISRINPAVTRRTGFAAQDLVGGPLQRVVQSALAPGQAETLDNRLILACMKDGRDLLDSPAVLLSQDDSRIAVTLSAYPLRDRDKTVGGRTHD